MERESVIDEPSEIPSLFKITRAQEERSERNRLKAKALQHSRLARKHPYTKPSDQTASNSNHGPSAKSSSDTCGGYILEEDEDSEITMGRVILAEDEVPPLPDEFMVCQECQKKFSMSYLFTHFSYSVCDTCRNKETHDLITKTDAKQEFLLKDGDLNGRDGEPLPFIRKKNPHRHSYGEMHLYLKPQVMELSYKIWDGPDGLNAEHERRNKIKEAGKQKQFTKRITELRQQIEFASPSLAKSYAPHQHVFPAAGEKGGEEYDPETDMWTKTCRQCGHTIKFEKM